MHPADQQEFDKLNEQRHKLLKDNADKDRIITEQAEIIKGTREGMREIIKSIRELMDA